MGKKRDLHAPIKTEGKVLSISNITGLWKMSEYKFVFNKKNQLSSFIFSMKN